jgi:hypothetical protein
MRKEVIIKIGGNINVPSSFDDKVTIDIYFCVNM